ncbi:hypothetical protein L3X38_018921 [Prunus dulcis]|uniref:Non-specific serine/threonine protein kinase n=1 Tax=Prunus dulcis TaxID=3755 RepID=A0AAD4WBP2_PRUDU|nr:hypothetical protein L3X38_018921 [Prunus dulcis]
MNNLENLVDLDIAINSLEGSIPLGSGSNLEWSIPSSFSQLKYLRAMHFPQNHLTGEIQSAYGSFKVFSISLCSIIYTIIGELPVVVIKLNS